MQWHTEILSDPQGLALRELAPILTGHDFYLAGGTALALIFGHRRSLDLDWFRVASIDDPLALAADIKDAGASAAVTGTARNTLYLDSYGVKVSAMRYHYPLLNPTMRLDEYSCELASIDDIACMKFSAIVGRAEKKDYFDLATVASRGYNLGTLLGAYQRKFGAGNIASVLQALSYFDDADQSIADIPEINKRGAWREAKRVLQEWVRSLPRDPTVEVDV